MSLHRIFLSLILGIFSVSLMAQQYDAAWLKIDRLEREGLTQSALTVADSIYQLAQKEQNGPQQVKALLRILAYQNQLEEKSDSLNIERVQAALKKAHPGLQQVLHSVLADRYIQYYQQNRYRILNRTQGVFEADDFQTWDVRTLQAHIAEQYRLSLQDAKRLQQIPVRDYQPILDTMPESPLYRPTLYDLLAHKALDYYQQDEYGLSQGQGAFQMSVDLITDAKTFLQTPLTSSDTLHFGYRALLLYQELLAFHRNDPVPFVDLEMQRLAYLKQSLSGKEAEARYLTQLEALSRRYPREEITAEVFHAIAQQYVHSGNQFDPFTQPDPKDDLKKAWQICADAIKRYPGSRGSKLCRMLQINLESPSLLLKGEDVVSSAQDFRIMLTHSNLKVVYFRIYPADFLNRSRMNNEERWNRLMAQTPVQAWTQLLPQTGDYQNHRLELPIEGLKSGRYMLLCSNDPEFDRTNHTTASLDFQSSQIAYYFRRDNEQFRFQLVDRESGKPLSGVQLEGYRWDWNTRSFVNLPGSWTSDKEGQALIPTQQMRDNFSLEIRYKEEVLLVDNLYGYYYGSGESARPETRAFFFLDRKIYRPGQTVYYKVLLLENNGNRWQIKPQTKTSVALRDVNGQEVSTQSHTTNEFGTLTGSFTAPTSGLTGQMRLLCENNSEYFSVEEYKRPRFEVSLDPPKKEYQLGEQIQIEGSALAYSGVTMEGATVRYRVTREVRYPFWRMWWRPMPSSPAAEIVNGEVLTDAEGKFQLSFEAIPDPTVDKDQKPVFTYSVNVDVSDITGETHSNSSQIKAGYVALEMALSIPEVVQPQQADFQLQVSNLNGQPVATPVTLRLERLLPPDEILRPRRWERPDQQILSETDYKKRFPHDVFAGEDEKENWETTLVSTRTLTTGTTPLSESVLFGKYINQSGKYRIKASILDPSGDSLHQVRYFQYQQANEKQAAWATVLEAATDLSTAQPGQTVQLRLASSLKKSWVRFTLYQQQKLVRDELILLKGKKGQSLSLPITEDSRGGMSWTVATVGLNHPVQQSGYIAVPWSNKELQLSWATFRSRLQPGQEEEWQLTIKGPQKDAVSAELVATLYDASLDAFQSNAFGLSLYPTYGLMNPWENQKGFGQVQGYGSQDNQYREELNQLQLNPRGYDQFVVNDYRYRYLTKMAFGMPAPAGRAVDSDADGVVDMMDVEVSTIRQEGFMAESVAFKGEAEPSPEENPAGESTETASPAIRKNLQETAFFFPQLQTDKEGNITLRFTMPEALTRWKFLGLAHTKELQIGTIGGQTVTQKELMVLPSLPRFLREGDDIRLLAKVSNLSEKSLSGKAQIRILDARTMQPLNQALGLTAQSDQSVQLNPGKSQTVAWNIKVPQNLQAVVVQITARSEQFSDGEEHVLPVLPNRMLVTETLPMAVLGGQEKTYTLKGLAEAGQSPTLSHHQLTLEFSSNPAWYAVQSLPYLMEFPHECTEQIFSRYYANALATHVANQSPRIKEIYAQWQQAAQQDNNRSFQSLLEQNQDLKSALLEETPWVREAQSESERKQRLGLLFDLNRMSQEQLVARRQLEERQNSTGAFSWFPGMQDNRYITQLIITGFGHLQKIGVATADGNPEINQMVRRAMPYLDGMILEDYNRLKQYKTDLKTYQPSNFQVQYLYMRSFFPDFPQTKETGEAYTYFYGQAQTHWLKYNRYMQGMLSLTFHRTQNQDMATKILASLKENAIVDPEKGMYWKNQSYGYYWDQPDIERHALLIEAFYEAGGDLTAVEQLKLWLLRNKRTHNWETTRATVAACNALLATGADWLESQELVAITLGGQMIDPLQDEAVASVEAGTGYFQRTWNRSEISSEMGTIRLKKTERGLGWGALYWQYFEQMDKIKFASTPLSVERKLFRVDNTAEGEKLVPIAQFEVGDKVRVQLTIRAEEAMEYVHLKDQRAALFEPVETLSGYHWTGGLGYYQSTRDVATNFFFDYLPKGTNVLEYDLFATQQGDCSQGISTLQSMYAPEFSAHSAGIRVQVR